MKDIRTKPVEKKPQELSQSAKVPKELLRKSIAQANENIQEIAEGPKPTGELPEQYAVNRLVHVANDTAHRTRQQAYKRGKQLAKKTREAYKQRGTENRSSFSSEDNAHHAGKEHARYNAQSTHRTAQNAQAQTTRKGTVKTTRNTVKPTRIL